MSLRLFSKVALASNPQQLAGAFAGHIKIPGIQGNVSVATRAHANSQAAANAASAVMMKRSDINSSSKQQCVYRDRGKWSVIVDNYFLGRYETENEAYVIAKMV